MAPSYEFPVEDEEILSSQITVAEKLKTVELNALDSLDEKRITDVQLPNGASFAVDPNRDLPPRFANSLALGGLVTTKTVAILTNASPSYVRYNQRKLFSQLGADNMAHAVHLGFQKNNDFLHVTNPFHYRFIQQGEGIVTSMNRQRVLEALAEGKEYRQIATETRLPEHFAKKIVGELRHMYNVRKTPPLVLLGHLSQRLTVE